METPENPNDEAKEKMQELGYDGKYIQRAKNLEIVLEKAKSQLRNTGQVTSISQILDEVFDMEKENGRA